MTATRCSPQVCFTTESASFWGCSSRQVLLMNHYIETYWKQIKQSVLLKDSLWAVVGNIVGKGLSLIAGIGVARLLGKDIYGEYGLLKNTILIIGTVSSFGLAYTATKFISEYKISDPTKVRLIHRIAVGITLFFSSVFGGGCILFSDEIASFLDAPHLAYMISLIGIVNVFNAYNATQIGSLAGLGAYKGLAYNNIITGIVNFVCTIFLTYYYDLLGAVIALLISYVANCLLNSRLLAAKLPPRDVEISSYCKDFVRRLLGFSLPIALQESVYSASQWLITLMLVKLSDFGELGINSAATQWGAVLLFIPSSIRHVALSHLSSSCGNIHNNRLVLDRLSKINFIATAVPALICVILSGWICSWYGATYQGLWPVLIVVIISTLIDGQTQVLSSELMSHKRNWYLFYARVIRDVFQLVLLYCLLYYRLTSGAMAAALVMVICNILYWRILHSKIRQIFKYAAL